MTGPPLASTKGNAISQSIGSDSDGLKL